MNKSERQRKNDIGKTEAGWGWPQANTCFHQTRGFLHTHERTKNPGSGSVVIYGSTAHLADVGIAAYARDFVEASRNVLEELGGRWCSPMGSLSPWGGPDQINCWVDWKTEWHFYTNRPAGQLTLGDVEGDCSCSLPRWWVQEIKRMYLASLTHGLFLT